MASNCDATCRALQRAARDAARPETRRNAVAQARRWLAWYVRTGQQGAAEAIRREIDGMMAGK